MIIHHDFSVSNETTSNFFELTITNDSERNRRKATFKKLAIAGYPKFDDEFGKYPVLYVDFSVCDHWQVFIVCSMLMLGAAQNVVGSTMKELLSKFKIEITDMVLQLEDAGLFQNREKLTPNLRKFLEEIIAEKLPNPKWPAALSKMTEVLHLLHERQVIVLMDEYDSPISYAAQHQYYTKVCPSSLVMSISHSFCRQIYFSARSSQNF